MWEHEDDMTSDHFVVFQMLFCKCGKKDKEFEEQASTWGHGSSRTCVQGDKRIPKSDDLMLGETAVNELTS